MSADELFHIINPDPTKHSLPLDGTKYELMRAIILANLQEYGPMSSREFGSLIEEQARGEFGGLVKWYFTIVKMNLEACGEIRRVLKGRLRRRNFHLVVDGSKA